MPIVESGGIPPQLQQFVIVLPWNDADALERTLRTRGDEIAAVIMEPINYNSGSLLPRPGYLEAVRRLTREHQVLLIFDEILSGFRTGPSCAQGFLGVTPDLCTLGKALGAGVPLSAFAGRREVMEVVSPLGHGGVSRGSGSRTRLVGPMKPCWNRSSPFPSRAGRNRTCLVPRMKRLPRRSATARKRAPRTGLDPASPA